MSRTISTFHIQRSTHKLYFANDMQQTEPHCSFNKTEAKPSKSYKNSFLIFLYTNTKNKNLHFDYTVHTATISYNVYFTLICKYLGSIVHSTSSNKYGQLKQF